MNFSIDKFLMILGFFLFLIGFLIFILNKIGIPFGKLPGDFYYKNGNFTFYFPLTSGILISIILTVLINILIRIFK